VAALGGRIDQMVANLFLLTLPELAGRNVSIVERNQTIFLIRDNSSITGSPGDMVSILPIGGDAIGVSNDGFEWPLRDETLPSGSPRGISNVLRQHQTQISVRKGMLLCIVTRRSESPL
jgi:thiamine pyrophosphokinase